MIFPRANNPLFSKLQTPPGSYCSAVALVVYYAKMIGKLTTRVVSEMARRPEIVHVYLLRKNGDNIYEYAIFQRADNPEWWQGVAGGVEDGETFMQAALREAFEEAGTPLNSTIYPLDTVSSLRSDIFSCRELWGDDVVVCPLFFFAIPFEGDIVLSDEHTEVRWLAYKEAEALVYFHDQKTALWELDQRLLRGNLNRSKGTHGGKKV